MSMTRRRGDWDHTAQICFYLVRCHADPKKVHRVRYEDFHPFLARRFMSNLSDFEKAKADGLAKGYLAHNLTEEERVKRLDAAIAKAEEREKRNRAGRK